MNNQSELFISALAEFKNSGYFRNGLSNVPGDIDEVYRLAVRLAYKDLQWRTVKNHSNDRKESNIIEIAHLYRTNIENNGNHIQLIREVKNVFNRDFGSTAPDQCFGKAQKVVNMTLKYLYCLNSPLITINYQDRDMPLDDRIFDFYYSYRKSIGVRDGDKVIYWSNMSEHDYLEIQRNLKNYMRDINLEMSPIEAEFIIWNFATAKLIITTFEKAKRDYEKLQNQLSTTYACFELINDQLD